ncbi:hypothetical protein PENTCL1PPCAC_12406, partial [Pristionchus entomophagus]
RGCTRKRKRRATTTQAEVVSVSDDDNEVFNCVKHLEDQEKLFSTYLFDDMRQGDMAAQILIYMDESLSEVFKCHLQSLKDKEIA